MARLSRVIAGIAASALVLVPVVGLAGAPAQAAGNKIGSGRAVVHVDTPEATVQKVGKHKYRITFPDASTGQWMGVRTVDGKDKVLVGDITAKQLANKWSKLRYGKAGVVGTLSWNTSSAEDNQAVAIKVDRPAKSGDGVAFTFTSPSAVPTNLSDVSLSLQRAPEKGRIATRASEGCESGLPGSKDVNIADDLWIYVKWQASNVVATGIYNCTNDNYCYGKNTLTNNDNTVYSTVGSNTCDDIKYVDAFTKTSSKPAYGVEFYWTKSAGSDPVYNLKYIINVTPEGQDAYQFTQVVGTNS